MPEINPFLGYIYNTKKIKDISKVLAPPYDVISSEIQDSLYKRSEFNIIRLILGKDKTGDNKTNNRYKRAKAFLDEIIAKDILTKDKKPSLYLYGQEYTGAGEKRQRLGFISLMKLEDRKNSSILPHERTFAKPRKDRSKLIHNINANDSPIFSIFEDRKNVVTDILDRESKKKPVFDVNFEGVRERLWRVSDSKIISRIAAELKNKQVFIADGHHRYEVALNYRDEMRKRHKKIPAVAPYDYIMMYFVGLDDSRLTILPTHRVVKNIGNLKNEVILSLLEEYFDIKKFKDFNNMYLVQKNQGGKFTFGMYCGNGFYLLKLKDTANLSDLIKGEMSNEWKALDVTVLHKLLLERVLKVKDKEGNIAYYRSASDAIEKVKNDGYKLALFLNPTRLEEVKDIALKGEKMPHKSTYFYPKLLTGVVINKFNGV